MKLAYLYSVLVAAVVGLSLSARAAEPDTNNLLPRPALVRLGSPQLISSADVLTLAVSPDGKKLAASLNDRARRQYGVIRLWDLERGTSIQEVPPSRGTTTWLQFSADGKKLHTQRGELTLGERPKWTPPPSGTALVYATTQKRSLYRAIKSTEAQVYDRATGKKVCSILASKSIGLGALSPDGKLAAVTTSGGGVSIHDASTGDRLHELVQNDRRTVRALRFSPDGTSLAIAGYLPEVKLFDVKSGSQLRSFRLSGTRHRINSLSFDAAGRRLAAGNYYGGTAQVWNTKTSALLHTVDTKFSSVTSTEISPDGRKLFVGGRNAKDKSTIFAWDLELGRKLFHGPGPQAAIQQVAFSPATRHIATASGDRVHIWHRDTGKMLASLRGEATSGLAYSPDGWLLAGVHLRNNKGGYQVWHAATGDLLLERSRGDRASPARCCDLSSQAGRVAFGRTDGIIELVDLASGELSHTIDAYPGKYAGVIRFSPDGRFLVSSANARAKTSPATDKIIVWDAASGMKVRELEARLPTQQTTSFVELRFSAVDSLLAGVHSNGRTYVWDYENGDFVREVPATAKPVALAREGYAAIHALGSTLQLTEVATGSSLLRIPTTKFEANTATGKPAVPFFRVLEVAPDGNSVATVALDDASASVWSLAPSDGHADSTRPLDTARFDQLWRSLSGDDATAAYRAMWQLQYGADAAAKRIAARISPAKSKLDQLQRLVANLDDDSYEVREAATEQIVALGKAVRVELNAQQSRQLSPEASNRIRIILTLIEGSFRPTTQAEVRRFRTIAVLERIGTPVAAKALEKMASGDPSAPESRRAAAALQRVRESSGLRGAP